MSESEGDDFQNQTKHARQTLAARDLDWESKPDLYKTYANARHIALPAAVRQGGPDVWDVMMNRRSVRQYSNRALSIGDLGQLLFAVQGITKEREEPCFRAVPSAGALYPLETYVAVRNVESLEPGLYHYDVRSHELELLSPGDCGQPLATAALGQGMLGRASAVFIWTAVFERTKWKYGQRAYRYVYLEAGHAAQNLAVAAVALGLATCQVGAFFDEEVNAILGVDDAEESAVYLSTVGGPR